MRILWITLLAVVIDQAAKFAVTANMYLSESIPLIGEWFRFTYTTNPGMAFGIAFGPRSMVTILSIFATVLIVAYIYLVRDGYRPYVASLALILGGALGNIIDRVFYGTWFYGRPLFTGEVVDFIHIDLGRVVVPNFVPVIGGSMMQLFPIWNVADMCIVGGVIGILVFQTKYHERRLSGQDKVVLDETPPYGTAAVSGVSQGPTEIAAPAQPGIRDL